MPSPTFARHLLEQHGIRTQTTSDGLLLALDVCIGPEMEDRSAWVAVNGWSVSKLLEWLGY